MNDKNTNATRRLTDAYHTRCRLVGDRETTLSNGDGCHRNPVVLEICREPVTTAADANPHARAHAHTMTILAPGRMFLVHLEELCIHTPVSPLTVRCGTGTSTLALATLFLARTRALIHLVFGFSCTSVGLEIDLGVVPRVTRRIRDRWRAIRDKRCCVRRDALLDDEGLVWVLIAPVMLVIGRAETKICKRIEVTGSIDPLCTSLHTDPTHTDDTTDDTAMGSAGDVQRRTGHLTHSFLVFEGL